MKTFKLIMILLIGLLVSCEEETNSPYNENTVNYIFETSLIGESYDNIIGWISQYDYVKVNTDTYREIHCIDTVYDFTVAFLFYSDLTLGEVESFIPDETLKFKNVYDALNVMDQFTLVNPGDTTLTIELNSQREWISHGTIDDIICSWKLKRDFINLGTIIKVTEYED